LTHSFLSQVASWTLISCAAKRIRDSLEEDSANVAAENTTSTQKKKLETPTPKQTTQSKEPASFKQIKMPAPGGTKRVRGVQIMRPFIYGTEAIPFDPEHRPKDAPPDHTHRWKVFVRGVNGEDISYWLRKVQFKLHDTYANSVRMIESPPFEVEETGWGEFEIAIKFYFVPESTEKPSTVWHALKLHPYGEDIEGQKKRRDTVKSICYEEVLFSEPVEQFFNILTGDAPQPKGKGKAGKAAARGPPTAEIPERITKENVYSREEESKELDRLGEAVKMVEKMITDEKAKLVGEDEKLRELEKTEGRPAQKKK
jgi:YEATS domain-containing protein 4